MVALLDTGREQEYFSGDQLMLREGATHGFVPEGLFAGIPTPDSGKDAHYEVVIEVDEEGVLREVTEEWESLPAPESFEARFKAGCLEVVRFMLVASNSPLYPGAKTVARYDVSAPDSDRAQLIPFWHTDRGTNLCSSDINPTLGLGGTVDLDDIASVLGPSAAYPINRARKDGEFAVLGAFASQIAHRPDRDEKIAVLGLGAFQYRPGVIYDLNGVIHASPTNHLPTPGKFIAAQPLPPLVD